VDRDVHVNGFVNLTFADMSTNCSACHGDAVRVVPDGTPAETAVALRAAPPLDTSGSDLTSDPGVGAHQAHLLPGPGAIAAPIACSECHVVPQDLTHVGPLASSPAKLTWGPIAKAKGATPGFDPVSVTCANYCHGQTLGAGGSNVAPIWTKVDGTQASCGTCHASPPGDPSHLLHASPDLVGLACSHCHPAGYTASSVGPTVVPIHVNGVVNTNATFLPDCNPTAAGPNGWTGTSVVGCHGGTRYWTDAVPPVGGCW
jgi:predicted CxxxxCH...CXXCH cytochrome family protein